MWHLALQYGDHGPAVRRLQELLNRHLPPSHLLQVDGEYGPRTTAAVSFFQEAAGISPDGVAGMSTWAALFEGMPQELRRRVPGFTADDFAVAPWMAIASRQIGISEIPGQDDNPQILKYHATTTLRRFSDETPWCSSFVNWCLRTVGIAGTNSAAALSWVNWGKPCNPLKGAITIIRNSRATGTGLTRSGYHVGFLVEETASFIKLLGGNQSDQVKRTVFSRASWQLVGHRWPKLGGKNR